MCDPESAGVFDVDPERREEALPATSRREFFRAAGIAGGTLLAASYGCSGGRAHPAPAASSPVVGSAKRRGVVTTAMHIHSCFSEKYGSMQAQLGQAAGNGIDVVWFTDHDWRMSQYGYRQVVHFDSLSGEVEAGASWTWQPTRGSGLGSASGGGIVSSPLSSRDPSTVGAISVLASASASAPASFRWAADASKARDNLRSNVSEQRISIDVYPSSIGPDAWLELLFTLSTRPATGGRPAGLYQISYRLGTAAASRSIDPASSLLGIVTVPVVAGQYQTVTVQLDADFAQLWPDLQAVAADNGLYAMWLGATARNRATASGYFDYLVFDRSGAAGTAPIALQTKLASIYAPQYPSVLSKIAQEVSYFNPHVNTYGQPANQRLYNYASYPNVNPGTTSNYAFATQIANAARSQGALSSYNHPLGYEGADIVLTTAQQDSLRRRTAAALIANHACNTDLFEAGYRSRGGCSLEEHLALWDTLSRNGIYLTGTGVSDNHTGTRWAREPNRFVTAAWAASTSDSALLPALAAGRSYVYAIASFSGMLDLLADNVAPMGAVLVQPGVLSHSLTITATGVPPGGSVEVIEGTVDYAGPSVPNPSVNTLKVLPASAFATGSTNVVFSASGSVFVRVAVLDQSGTRVAFSNPVWLLAEQPRTTVPPSRLRT